MFNSFLKSSEKKLNHPELQNDLLEKKYQELIIQHHIQNDAGQVKVLGHLQYLLDNIFDQVKQSKLFTVSGFFSTPQKTIKNLYIYGDVGRGKSMLMDVFFEACPFESKRRVHFHAFMQEIHEYMHQWRKNNKGDPLPSLALEIRKTSLLLCFDEFHITDIADAMLLSRLFKQLFKQGVVFVATSNQHPDELYKNGLQRELFLPFINELKKSSDILELIAKEDYRLSYFNSMTTVFYLDSDGLGHDFLRQRFNELTNDGVVEKKTLRVKGRNVIFETVHGDILFSSFEALCGRALGPADYLAVANEFNTILIESIPDLSVETRDKVRRFVTLIDALYERNVKIICTLAVSVESLCYKDSDFDFKRTRSRLLEMRSEKYFQRKHLEI